MGASCIRPKRRAVWLKNEFDQVSEEATFVIHPLPDSSILARSDCVVSFDQGSSAICFQDIDTGKSVLSLSIEGTIMSGHSNLHIGVCAVASPHSVLIFDHDGIQQSVSCEDLPYCVSMSLNGTRFVVCFWNGFLLDMSLCSISRFS